jgi:uncharacterized membrane protein HdeD (DUF308 family)
MSKWIGVLMIVFGVIAIASPVIASAAVSALLGWLFIIAGIAEIAYAFTGGRMLANLVMGGLTVVAGGIMVFSPLAGALTLAWLLVFWCFLRGIMQVFTSFQLTEGRGWMLVSGILSVLLAVMIWRGWPSTAIWALGLLVGLNLISAGVVIVSASSKKAG